MPRVVSASTTTLVVTFVAFSALVPLPVAAAADAQPPCSDTSPPQDCRRWAASGECDANPGFMKTSCKRSCGLCPTAEPADEPADEPKAGHKPASDTWKAAKDSGVLTALFCCAVPLLSAIFWVWLDRRGSVARGSPATGRRGLGDEERAALRDQRLKKIGQSHAPGSPSQQPPPVAARPSVSPPRSNPDVAAASAATMRAAAAGAVQSSSSSPAVVDAGETSNGAEAPSLRERWAAWGAGLVGSPAAGGPTAASSTGDGTGGRGRGRGNGADETRDERLRQRWLAQEEEHQLASSGPSANGEAQAHQQQHWTTLFASADAGEEVLQRFAGSGAGVGRRCGVGALLVVIEGSDPASLHLLRDVWPSRALFDALHNNNSGSVDGDGDGGGFDGDGDGVVALRVSTRAPQCGFWLHELAVSSPAVMLLSGAHGVASFRPRSLAAPTLAAAVRRAAAAARDAVATTSGQNAVQARGEAMLARYRAWQERGWRPPPSAPRPAPPPAAPPPAAGASGEIIDAQTAEYAAALAQDEAIEAAEAAAAAERAEEEEAAKRAARDAELEQLDIEARKEKRRNARRHKGARLPAEPAAASPDAVRVLVRMRDGRRLQRRFDRGVLLKWVVGWIESEDVDGDDFALVSNFPRASSRSAESRNTSLAQLGLWPNCSLFVEEVDEEEVEDELDEREAWVVPEDE